MSTSSNQVTLSAADFIDSIGVNMPVGASTSYNNAALLTDSLTYLGVSRIRTGLTADAVAKPVLDVIAEEGYKLDLGVSSSLPAQGSSGVASYLKALDAFNTAHPGSVVAVEGLNEEDIQAFSYYGSSSTTAAAAFQSALYRAVSADPVLAGISVYNFTISDYNNGSQSASVNDGASADYANAHAYVGTNTTPQAALARSVALAEQMTGGGKPVVITETGYSTIAGTSTVNVDEVVQAKSILDTLLDAFKAGVSTTYLYQLLDNDSLSPSDKEAHFGLFNADGTPKLAATAIHNLTSLLADNAKGGAPSSSTFNYSLGNLPSSGSSMVLAKSGGVYDLVIWAEPKVWDSTAGREVTNTAQKVSVNLGGVYASVKVYDPLVGKDPIATYTNTNTLSIAITDHPVVIEVATESSGATSLDSNVAASNVSGTAADIVTKLSSLNKNAALTSIKLTDTNVLAVASTGTMGYIIAHYQHALSAIQGSYGFSVTNSDTNWSKTVVYDSLGKELSNTSSGYSNGVITSSLTTYASGKTDAISYSSGVATLEIVGNADGSKNVFNYNVKGQNYDSAQADYDATGALTSYVRRYANGKTEMSQTFLASGAKSVTYYNESGVPTTGQYFGTDGSVGVTVYKDGVKTAQYVTNADKGLDTYVYNVTGQPYTSQRFHSNSSGVVTGTFWYNASGGVIYSKVIANDGSVSIYNSLTDGGLKTYDSSGALVSDVVTASDGSTTTSLYSAGVKTKGYTVHADKTQDNYFYNVTGQSYTSEHDHVNASGAVDLIQRYLSTGKMVYSQALNSDGSKVTDTYSSTGVKVSEVTATSVATTTDQFDSNGIITSEVAKGLDGSTTTSLYSAGVKTKVYAVHADKTQDNYFYNVTGQSYTSEHDHVNASGTVDTVTRSLLDGSLQVRAYTGGLLLSGGQGNDAFTSAGGDTFAFAGNFGKDTIQNFSGAGVNHDILQFSKATASDFAHLTIAQSGQNTVISAGSHGAISLLNTSVSNITQSNFSFV